jgi:hypothetical protein
MIQGLKLDDNKVRVAFQDGKIVISGPEAAAASENE